MLKKGYISNPAKCACANGMYLDNIIDDLVIYDKVIETTKGVLIQAVPTKGFQQILIKKI